MNTDTPDSAPAAEPSEPLSVNFKYEVLTPVEGFDAIYTEYATTFGRFPDAFMAKVVGQTKQDLFIWWAAHREDIREALVDLETKRLATGTPTGAGSPASLREIDLALAAMADLKPLVEYGVPGTYDTVQARRKTALTRAEGALLSLRRELTQKETPHG